MNRYCQFLCVLPTLFGLILETQVVLAQQDSARPKLEQALQPILDRDPEADTNQDGWLTAEEARDRFPEADVNQDGKISPVEARDYLFQKKDLLSMQNLIRGSGASMEVLLRGELIYETLGVSPEGAKVKVTLDYNDDSQVFDADVFGSRFEIWLPINRLRWYVMYVEAQDDSGYLGRIPHITRPAFRNLALKSLRLTMHKPNRIVTVLTHHEGNPVAGTTVRLGTVSGGYYGMTNSEGIAEVLVLESDELWEICAWNKAGFFGGFRFVDDSSFDSRSDQQKIELYKAIGRVIKVTDADGQPISNVPIKLHTATPPPEYNYFGIPDDSLVNTNDQGIAVWPWYPLRDGLHEYVALSGADQAWVIADQSPTKDTLNVQVRPSAKRRIISGIVESKHRSAAGINVELDTFQFGEEQAAHLSTLTDSTGRFEVEALEDVTYVVFVNDEVLVSPHQSAILYESALDRVNAPILQLEQGIPVEVKFTIGKDAEPYPVTGVNVDFEHHFSWQQGGRGHSGTGGRRLVLDANNDGLLRFHSAEGKIQIRAWSDDWREKKSVDIVKGVTNHIAIHRDILEEVAASGIVASISTMPSANQNATVRIGAIDGKINQEVELNTNAEGEFSFKTKAKELAIIATSVDKTFAGTLLTRDVSKPLKVELHPTATYSGQLFDEEQSPVVNHPIDGIVVLRFEEKYGGVFPTSYTVRIQGKTDSLGRFQLDGLPVNVPIKLMCDDLQDQDPSTIHLIDEVLLKPAEFRRGETSVVRRTRSDAKLKPLSERFELAARNAKLGGFHLLVIGGALQDDKVKSFVNEYVRNQSRNKDLYRYVQLNYDSTDSSETDAIYARKWNWPSRQSKEAFIVAYDTQGMELARLPFDVTRQTSTSDVADFIAKYAPPIEDARRKWEEAFSLAKSTDRRVWVRISGNYCAPCFALSRWIDDHRDTLSKDFVMLKIDPSLDINGKEIADQLVKDRLVGIPFHAMLDANGQMIMDSYGPLGNIGFPSSGAESIEHFRSMLETASRTLSKEVINELISSLH